MKPFICELKCFLQDVIDTQEKTINDLLKSVKEQHDQLNSQKNKIKSLEEKVGKRKQCRTPALTNVE